jgi:hypothetical protein
MEKVVQLEYHNGEDGSSKVYCNYCGKYVPSDGKVRSSENFELYIFVEIFCTVCDTVLHEIHLRRKK